MTKKIDIITKKVWLCTNCQSDNVEVKRWVNPNTHEIGDSCSDDEDEDCFCNDCLEHDELEIVEMPIDAHIVGFQVTGDGVNNAGEMHPDMMGLSFIYSLSQAREMLEKESNDVWALDTIWSGDYEVELLREFNDGIRD